MSTTTQTATAKTTTTPTDGNPLDPYTAGFYNDLVENLQASASTFQLVQGAFGLPNSDMALSQILDGVPPQSVSFFTPNNTNTLSGNYGVVLDSASSAEQQTRTYGTAYQAYNNTDNWYPGSDGNSVAGVGPMYTPDHNAVENLLNNGTQVSFQYDSATADSSLSGAWSQQASSAGIGFWGESSDQQSTQVNALATSSEVTVSISLTYASTAIEPGGWYFTPFMIEMYGNKNNWNGGAATWNTVFGSNGTLPRLSQQVFVATNIVIELTSKATYSEADYQYIKSSHNVNVWPFYTSSSNNSSGALHVHNADGSITSTIKSLPGALQIIGFSVEAVSSLM